MKRFLLFLICFPVALATSYPAYTLEELYTRADYVAYGTVETTEQERDRTTLTLVDHEVLLGDETIDVLTWFTTKDIAGLTIPAAGDRVLVFAYVGGERLSPMVGFAHGLFTVTNDRYVNASGYAITLDDEDALGLTTEQRDGVAIKQVQEALAAPTFAERSAADAEVKPSETEEHDTVETREIPITVSQALLDEAVFARALAAWNTAFAGQARIVATASDEPAIAIGPADQLADAVSVTYRADGQLFSEVNVRTSSALVFNALLLELGVHAGAQPGTSPAVTTALPTSERILSSADVDAVLSRVTHVLGDMNQDGVVDFLDLVLLAAQHGERGIHLPGDLNNDGVVDDADVAILKEHYSFTAPEKP